MVFEDSFNYFNKNKYYDKVLNKIGTKRINDKLIRVFFKDILRQYNSLYRISAGIENYLSSKRNKKLFLSYTKSLLIVEENFKFIDELKLFRNTFDEKVGNGNSRNGQNNRNGQNGQNNRNGRNNRDGHDGRNASNNGNASNGQNNLNNTITIYKFFKQIKSFIEKIHKHEIETKFNEHQSLLIFYYLVFDNHNRKKNDNDEITKKIKKYLPNLDSRIKSFINEFNEYSKSASRDYKTCQLYFKNDKTSSHKFIRENTVFILILNYQNIFKCIECIHDLISDIGNMFKIQITKKDELVTLIKSMTSDDDAEKKEKVEEEILTIFKTL